MHDILGTVVSINPNDDISIEADEKLFDLYTSSKEKNSGLNAYNELKSFTRNLLQERKEAIDHIRECEKWFKKKIEFLEEHKAPYRVGKATEQDRKRIVELVESYPDMDQPFEVFEEYKKWGMFRLSAMIYYIESNMDFFEKVDMVSLADSGKGLYEAILQFDFIHVLHERSNDLVQLILKDRFDEGVKRGDFVRSLEEIKERKKNALKPGPKVPEKLIEDIKGMFEVILDPDASLYDEEREKELFENGKLVISRVVSYAEGYPYFANRWVNEDARYKEGGYSRRSLEKHFSRVYEEF